MLSTTQQPSSIRRPRSLTTRRALWAAAATAAVAAVVPAVGLCQARQPAFRAVVCAADAPGSCSPVPWVSTISGRSP